ncbi:MAG: T9SS type A sorting domain-containing protein, partial [Salibacteraceae bacterium]
YTISVTDSAGCLQTGSYALSDSGSASLSIVGTANNCSNESTAYASVTAIGNAPFTYQWNDPIMQTADTAFNLANGLYAVSVVDTNGCTAVDTINIGSIFDAPTVDLGDNQSACIGDEVILTPGGGFNSYNWNTGDSSVSIAASVTQIYEVTVSDQNGCFGEDSVFVEFVSQPLVNLGSDTIICTDDFSPSVTLDAGEGYLSYDWSTNDTTQTIVINDGGLYKVTVSNAPGCFGSDAILVVYDTCVNVTIDEPGIAEKGRMVVYPNPNRGEFTVEAQGLPYGVYDLSLMNASGQLVLDKKVTIKENTDSKTRINVEHTPRGVYLLIFENDGLRYDQRVIIQ